MRVSPGRVCYGSEPTFMPVLPQVRSALRSGYRGRRPAGLLWPIADMRQLLLDHLVGAGKKGARHREAKRPRCLEIDGQFEFGGQLYRKLVRLRTAQNAIDV